MIYFVNAKNAFNATDAPYSNGSNVGPGFMIDDAYTMEIERARYSEARISESGMRRIQFVNMVLFEQQYDDILAFAPEDHRCMECSDWKMNHTEDYFNGYKWTMHCDKCECTGFVAYGASVI